MYIKYVNTGDSSLTAERSFFEDLLNLGIFDLGGLFSGFEIV